jgi:predicted TIM-barrel fold metal-dependent hydrolase
MLQRTLCELFVWGRAMNGRISRRFASSCRCCQPEVAAVSRRTVLSGLAAAAVAASTSGGFAATPVAAEESAPASRLSFIDVHHHFVPPAYLAENRERVSSAALQWEPQKALDAMDAENVATAVLSLPLPGVWFGDVQASRRMSRLCNDYAADLSRDHRGRFGMFPVVPLPDTEGSLREIEYALDVLKADGIGLLTSYFDSSGSRWLGNFAFEAVFEELNRRKAVVFVHPTVPTCCQKLLPDVSPLVSEIPQDTTRAVTNLLFTGTFARFKDIRFIFSHAGGDVPMVMGRMYDYAPKNIVDVAPNGIEYELTRLYYDVAGTARRPAIAALTKLVPMKQILFGSDNPFVPLRETAHGIHQLDLSAADLQAISRDNALTLMPNLGRG